MTDTAEGAAAQLGTRAVSNSVFILAARTVSRVISLVVVIVLANALGDTGYGQYATLITWSALVSVVADFGFAPLVCTWMRYPRRACSKRRAVKLA